MPKPVYLTPRTTPDTAAPSVPVRGPSLSDAVSDNPFWCTKDGETVRLYQGHVIDRLNEMPEKSIHCCVTSPPYWGLRDYGTGTWDGGDSDCDHKQVVHRQKLAEAANKCTGGNRNPNRQDNGEVYKEYGSLCGKCGATRKDQQLGSEPSPDCGTHGKAQCGRCFVCAMVGVFRGVRRVLRDDGTLWLNLGDTYSTGNSGFKESRTKDTVSDAVRGTDSVYARRVHRQSAGGQFSIKTSSDLPSGNLVGVPWRVALALQADGWVLRQDVIWHKPAPMPESVRNRCTKAHEYVFLLTKSARYFYDAEAIKQKATESSLSRNKYGQAKCLSDEVAVNREQVPGEKTDGFSNKRSVWTVSSQGYEGAHFATFPTKLIEPMILAGTSEKGCCAECGTPWERVTEIVRNATKTDGDSVYERDRSFRSSRNGIDSTLDSDVPTESKTVGWRPGCECHGKFVKRKIIVSGETVAEQMERNGGRPSRSDRYVNGNMVDNDGWTEGGATDAEQATKGGERTVLDYVPTIPLEDHPIVPCTVLDPFVGSGTTCQVAFDHGRYSVGIDLSEKYLTQNAIPRIEGAILSVPSKVWLVRKKIEPVVVGESMGDADVEKESE